LIKPNFCFDVSHRHSTTVSLESRNPLCIGGFDEAGSVIFLIFNQDMLLADICLKIISSWQQLEWRHWPLQQSGQSGFEGLPYTCPIVFAVYLFLLELQALGSLHKFSWICDHCVLLQD